MLLYYYKIMQKYTKIVLVLFGYWIFSGIDFIGLSIEYGVLGIWKGDIM